MILRIRERSEIWKDSEKGFSCRETRKSKGLTLMDGEVLVNFILIAIATFCN